MDKAIIWLNNLFGIGNETSAPILITLFTFFVSYLFLKIGSFIKKQNENKVYKKIFILAIERLIKQIDNQSKEFSRSSNSFTFENDRGFRMGRVQLFPSNVFESIGYKQTIESVLLNSKYFCLSSKNKQVKTRALNKIWESIFSINYWHQKIIIDNTEFNEKYNFHGNKRNDAFEILNEYFIELFDLYQGKPDCPETIYLEKVVKIRENWVKIDESIRTRPDIVNDDFVQVLRNLNRDHFDLQIAVKMNQLLLKLFYEYIEQKNILEFHRSQVQTQSIVFKNYAKLLKKCIEIIK